MNKKRLLKLANYLENNKLGHAIFDFNYYNITLSHDKSKTKKKNCGTRGCAIGEMPFVDRKNWIFTEAKDPVLRTSDHFSTTADAKVYFGLNHEQYTSIFVGSSYYDKEKELITPIDVANRIKEFVETGV